MALGFFGHKLTKLFSSSKILLTININIKRAIASLVIIFLYDFYSPSSSSLPSLINRIHWCCNIVTNHHHVYSILCCLPVALLLLSLLFKNSCKMKLSNLLFNSTGTVNYIQRIYHRILIIIILFNSIYYTLATTSLIHCSKANNSDCLILPISTDIVETNLKNKLHKLIKRSESMNNLHRHHHQHHPHYLNLLNEQNLNVQHHKQRQQTLSSQVQAYHHFHNQLSSGQKSETTRRLQQQSQQQRQHDRTITNTHQIHHSERQHVASEWHSAINFQPNEWTIKRSHQIQKSSPHNSYGSQYSSYQPSNHFQSCPEGPPSQWRNQLDVAGKALLSPVVFYGQLISLAEDYGGRIGATFRLLKMIKPNILTINSHLYNKNHQHNINNNSNEDLSMFLINKEYETHIKLYFVRHKNESLELPFCALYMSNIWDKLRTKERYILFAHQQILFSRGFMIPPSSPTFVSNTRSVPSSQHYTNDLAHNSHLYHHSHQIHHYSSSSSSRTVKRLGHQLISLVTYAVPEILSRNTSRLVRKILCRACAKPAIAHAIRESLDIIARRNITLECRVDGNPIPWIEWYRNGKRLRTRRRVFIHTRRRISRLTIVRASITRDTGTYECRAMNVVSKEPSVRRFRVSVAWSPGSYRHKPYGKGRKHSFSKFNDYSGHGVIVTGSRRNYHALGPNIDLNHESEISEFHAQPCPIAFYCLNGGTCSLYESVGEYVCQCADGYRGQRCEFKDLLKYPRKTMLDL